MDARPSPVEDDRARTSVPWGFAIAATLIALGTIALIWIAAVPFGSGVCPAIDPPPTNCLASYRAGSGLVVTAAVAAVYVVTLLAALLQRWPVRAIAVAGMVLLALAPVVTYAAVAWSPGFVIAAANGSAPGPAAPAPPTEDPVGQWGERGERSAFLTIRDDGTVLGSDGCNGLSGTWHLVDGVVEFVDMISSLMMCPKLESDLRGPVAAAIVKDDEIYVLDSDGGLSGVLSRAADEQ